MRAANYTIALAVFCLIPQQVSSGSDQIDWSLVDRLANSNDYKQRQRAIRCVVEKLPVSDKGIEHLIRAVDDPSWEVRQEAASALGIACNKSVLARLVRLIIYERNERVKKTAIGSLCSYKSHALIAVPVLIRILSDPASYECDESDCCGGVLITDTLAGYAGNAMVCIGGGSALPVARVLKDPGGPFIARCAASSILKKLGEDANTPQVTKIIRQIIENDNEKMRILAINTLVAVDGRSKSSLRSLYGAISDDSELVKAYAAIALQVTSPENLIFRPVVIKCLYSLNKYDRSEVITSVARAATHDDKAISLLIEFYSKADKDEKKLIITMLSIMTSKLKLNIKFLMSLSVDNDREIRDLAMQSLKITNDNRDCQ